MRTARRTRTAARAELDAGTPAARTAERGGHRRLVVAGLAGLGVPLLAASALASPLAVGATATTTTGATGPVGAVADVALTPLRTTGGSLQLCPGETTSVGADASAGSLAVVRPRLATSSWVTSTAGGTTVTSPSLATTAQRATAGASASAGAGGVRAHVPVVSYVVGATRVTLPPLQLQQAVSAVRSDVRDAVGFVPTVQAAVDAGARGAAVSSSGPLALALDGSAPGCVDLEWQLLG